MKRKTLMSWSSGKDSAWALYKLQQDPQIEIDGLFCTVNSEFNRVSMHAIRVELLKQQASCIACMETRLNSLFTVQNNPSISICGSC